MSAKANPEAWWVLSVLVIWILPGLAAAGTIYVDMNGPAGGDGKGWSTAYKYLQDGLATAKYGDQIRVADGTYTPDANSVLPNGSGNRAATFLLKSGVALYGGYAGFGWPDPNERDIQLYEAILSGDLNANDGTNFANYDENSYHVVTASETDEATILDGFTITAGNANGLIAPLHLGAGMYNKNSNLTVANCTLSRNVAIAGPTGMGAGMYNENNSPTAANCIFIGNFSTYGSGMYNKNNSPKIINCSFSGNTATDSGGGMYNSDSVSVVVTNCTFSGNSAGNQCGGMYNASDELAVTVANTILWDNTDSGPTDESAQIAGSTPLINYCCVQDWTGGLGGTGNIGTNPLFVDADGPDNVAGTEDDNLHLTDGSPCIDAGSNTAVPADFADLDADSNTSERTPLDLDGRYRFVDHPDTTDTGVSDPPDYPEVVDMGSYEYEYKIYVDSTAGLGGNGKTWATAYRYLQDALAQAQSTNVHIWVAEGTYKPDQDEDGNVTPGDQQAAFELISGVEIYGGFPSGEGALDQRDPNYYETILSGDLTGNDDGFANNDENSYHVVTGSGVDNTAVIDGFTITAGNANGDDSYSHGGGMYNSTGSPTVTDCTFTFNSANANGGGLYNYNSSNPVISNCTFSDNYAGSLGGGMYNYLSSNPSVTNCTFTDNSAYFYGGGMMNDISTPMLTRCRFSGNRAESQGGGIFNYNGSPILTNCTFNGNCATGSFGSGGGLLNYSYSSPIITNCAFSGNRADFGGAIYNDQYSHPDIADSSFSGNVADYDGGGIYNSISNPMLANCIFWGNNDSEGSDESAQIHTVSGTPVVTYSCIQGMDTFSGNGNIDDDPLFVRDPNAGADGWGVGDNDDFGDLHLALPFSPCVDTGSNASVPPDAADLDGDDNIGEQTPWDLDDGKRIVDGNGDSTSTVDMGAYEFAKAFIVRDPAQFLFFGPSGGVSPTPQILSIWNTGAGLLNWEITPDCDWLNAEPAAGTATTDPNEVILTIDTSGLAYGNYNCGLTISAPNAVNNPQTVQVELRIVKGDFDGDGDVDAVDFAAFAEQWQDTGCGQCAGADYTGDGNVLGDDFTEFIENWLTGTY